MAALNGQRGWGGEGGGGWGSATAATNDLGRSVIGGIGYCMTDLSRFIDML